MRLFITRYRKSLLTLLTTLVLFVGVTPRRAAALDSTNTLIIAQTATTVAMAVLSDPNFYKMLAKIPPALEACKEKFCASCAGDLVNGMLKPITLASGGCIQCCPAKPSAKQQAQAGALGACAKLTADLVDAKERVEAVKCLASADCNYWPEAEKALIGYLRADKNECVRLYAAIALLNGCCCNKRTIKALEISATGSNADGNPRENSRRVRSVARQALERCLSQYTDPGSDVPNEPPPPVQPPISPVPPASQKLIQNPPDVPTPPAEPAKDTKADAGSAPVGSLAFSIAEAVEMTSQPELSAAASFANEGGVVISQPMQGGLVFSEVESVESSSVESVSIPIAQAASSHNGITAQPTAFPVSHPVQANAQPVYSTNAMGQPGQPTGPEVNPILETTARIPDNQFGMPPTGERSIANIFKAARVEQPSVRYQVAKQNEQEGFGAKLKKFAPVRLPKLLGGDKN